MGLWQETRLLIVNRTVDIYLHQLIILSSFPLIKYSLKTITICICAAHPDGIMGIDLSCLHLYVCFVILRWSLSLQERLVITSWLLLQPGRGKCWQGKSIAIFLVCVGHILRTVVPVFFCSLLCHSFQCSFTWHIHLFMGLSPSTCVLRHLCRGQGTSLDGCPFILLWDWIFCCFTIVNTKITCWQLYQDSHLVLWLANTHYGIQLYVRALGNQAQLSCLLNKTLPTESSHKIWICIQKRFVNLFQGL